MYVKVILFLTLVQVSLVVSVRLVSPNETDLVPTEAPERWPLRIACDFDYFSMCGWTNRHLVADEFDWRLGRGKDSHKKRKKNRTGVKDDHGKGRIDYGSPDGGYIYISSQRKNRTAKLISKTFRLTRTTGCLKFWYHMRGKHMGHLKLFQKVGIQSPELLWQIYGAQGVFWNEGIVPIQPSDLSKFLLFEAFDWEAGVAGNIVLDDITFDPLKDKKDCVFEPADAAPPTEKPIMTTSTLPPSSTRTIFETSTQKLSATSASKDAVTVSTGSVENSTGTLWPTETRQFTSSLQNAVGTISKAQNGTVNTIPTVEENTYTALLNETEFTGTVTYTSKQVTVKAYSTYTNQKHSVPQNVNQVEETSGRNEILTKRPRDNSTIFAVASVCSAFVIVAVALLWFLKYRKRRSFNFYDNSTVHMTRMYPEVVKSETFMEYSKLT